MATPEEISFVRGNIGQTDLTDAQIGALVDTYGPQGAIATIWESKAATYADMVDTSEAGASLSLSNLSKQAMSMAAYWRSGAGGNGGSIGGAGVYIKQIVRDA
jgi:hypothetical protein